MDGVEQQAALAMLMLVVAKHRDTHREIVDSIILHVIAAEEAPEDRALHLEAALREAARIV